MSLHNRTAGIVQRSRIVAVHVENLAGRETHPLRRESGREELAGRRGRGPALFADAFRHFLIFLVENGCRYFDVTGLVLVGRETDSLEDVIRGRVVSCSRIRRPQRDFALGLDAESLWELVRRLQKNKRCKFSTSNKKGGSLKNVLTCSEQDGL